MRRKIVKKTKFFNDLERKWLLVDAKDQVLGRLAARVARILQGKTKAAYSPNFLCGDKVIVVNAKYLKITGNKIANKSFDRYTGYPGGLKEIKLKDLLAKNPIKAFHMAVEGMLPKTWLGKRMLRGLKIYPEASHDQEAQKPVEVKI
jgi:large subunit ribosomal protein L13